MRIVISSLTFLPNVGGLENIIAGLAERWTQLNHEVVVFTLTKSNDVDNYPFKVVRGRVGFSLLKAVWSSDVYLEANISLKTFWIGLLNRRKWFVSHHLPYQHDKKLTGKLKNFLTLFSQNIAVSHYIQGLLRGKARVIHNFYNDDVFKTYNEIQKIAQILYVGRLVSDKGVDTLLHAVQILNMRGHVVNCTVIGDGPEKANLQLLSDKLKIRNFVSFLGILKGHSLVTSMNLHKVLVIPSKWEEPFGIVALEGLACGCIVVCTGGGGLKEAVGETGIIVPNGSAEQLATAIETALGKKITMKEHHAIQKHLSNCSTETIAKQYLGLFTEKIDANG